MSFLVFWLFTFSISGLMTCGCLAWYPRHAPNESLTLQEILIAIGFCAIPYFNFIVMLAAAGYFFNAIAPKIIVFGKKK